MPLTPEIYDDYQSTAGRHAADDDWVPFRGRARRAAESDQTRLPENSAAKFSASLLEPNSHKTTVSLLFPVEIRRNGSICRVFNQRRISSTHATTSWPGNLTSTVTARLAAGDAMSRIGAAHFIGHSIDRDGKKNPRRRRDGSVTRVTGPERQRGSACYRAGAGEKWPSIQP